MSIADSVTIIQKHALRPFIRTLPLIALAFVNFALFGTSTVGGVCLVRYSTCDAELVWDGR